MLNRKFLVAGCLSSLAVIGCPTWRTEHKVETTHKIEAHIVLDIRRIQDEAAQVENEVRSEPVADSATKPQSMMIPVSTMQTASRSIWSIFDTATSASAEEVSSGERDAIDRRKQRLGKVDSWLTEGCLGENNKGMLEMQTCAATKSGDVQAEIKKLMADENADRKIIYAGIAGRQGLKAEHSEAVGEVYSAEIRKKLKPHQKFQVPSKDKLYQEFQGTALGKKNADAKPGQWVVVK